MATQDPPIAPAAVRYGLYTAAGLSAYRLLATYVNFGLIGSPEVLNVLILACGIVVAIGQYRRRLGHPLPYGAGMRLGMFTSLVSMAGYAVFAFAFYQFADPAYLRRVIHYPPADEPNAYEIAATALFEGLAYGVIVTLATMQYFTLDRTDKRFDEAYE
ncbi:MAG TPA: DUF4199 domain-containing protein [Cytophagales bacterium]|jgi:hypothetical protein